MVASGFEVRLRILAGKERACYHVGEAVNVWAHHLVWVENEPVRGCCGFVVFWHGEGDCDMFHGFYLTNDSISLRFQKKLRAATALYLLNVMADA